MATDFDTASDILSAALDAGATAVLLAGPTASGKSALALKLAAHTAALGREPIIVNADSMQVYAEMRILSARPTPSQEAQAPHHLFGHVSVRTPYSVAQWLCDVEHVLSHNRKKLPIFVGGTGLYFHALTQGLAPLPPIDPDVRARWRQMAADRTPADLHSELSIRDPASAKSIRPSDPQRLVRALEVIESTGRSLLDWQVEPASSPLINVAKSVKLVLDVDRDLLRERVAVRFQQMVTAGAVAEARAIMSMGLPTDATALKAIGLRELAAVHSGDRQIGEGIAQAITATNRYAKRQRTWFRQRMAGWLWIKAGF